MQGMSSYEFALWRTEFELMPWDPSYAKSEYEEGLTDAERLRKLADGVGP